MSISLPNGTILTTPSQPQLSAAVTRILHLAKFPIELKTRDLQLIFKDWENEKGGFRIKWVDDVNTLVVFADATVAKRAYLSILLSPPPSFAPPALIRPYDRPDAAQIIQSLAARSMGHRSSMSSALTSGNFANLPSQSISINPNSQIQQQQQPSLNGFVMPTTHSRTTSRHQKTGSASASSSWGRQSLGTGALHFNSNFSSQRLPTHSEGDAKSGLINGNGGVESRSASSSGTEDTPMIIMDEKAVPSLRTGNISGAELQARRNSVSAEKAMREVEKALASVEAKA